MRGRELGRAALLFVACAAAIWLVVPAAARTAPLYWDAAAVYGPGAKWLAEHGFDARPGVFPADLGRGHPPLYYLWMAAWMRAMGAKPVLGPALSLAAAALSLFWSCRLGARLGRPRAGVFAAILLCASPLFASMSTQLLPELTMTALAALCLLMYADGRMYLCALAGVLLVLCKETGIAVPLGIAGAECLCAWRARRVLPERGALWVGGASVLALGAFFAWQWAGEGWIVLPYHQGLFADRALTVGHAVEVGYSIAALDGRWAASAVALACAAVFVRSGGGPWQEPRAARVMLAAALGAAAFMGFFAKMFWLRRYGLPAHPGVCLAVGLVLDEAGRRWLGGRAGALVPAAVVAAAAVLGLRELRAGMDVASGETTFRWLDVVAARQEAYRALDAYRGTSSPFVLTAWPMEDELREPWLGWTARAYDARSIDGWKRRLAAGSSAVPVSPDAVVLQVGCCDEARLREHTRGLRPIATADVHGARVEVWGRSEGRGAAADSAPR